MTNYQALAAQDARQAGISPSVFTRQINQESGFSPTARSKAGAIGIAQIVPGYHPEVNPNDPVASLRWAANYDAGLLRKYHNWSDTLSVYNSGKPWARGRNIAETNNYVRSILNNATGGGAQEGTSSPGSGAGFTQPDFKYQLQQFLLDRIQKRQGGQPVPTITDLARSRLAAGAATDVFGPSPSLGPVSPSSSGATGGAAAMLAAIRLAQQMGLKVSENPYVGQVHPVHVSDSYHYRDFKGTYSGRKLGEAIDVTGSPAAEAAYTKRLEGTKTAELFYTPVGLFKYGKPINDPTVAAGHRTHVHVAYGG